MSEKKSRNPFEDHINSELFDVSNLTDLPERSEMAQSMDTFFEEIDQPLNHELWEEALDEQQQLICAQLCEEMIDRILRPQYGEALDDLTDDQLIHMMMVPVALSMLAEERLHESSSPELTEAPQAADHPLDYPDTPQPIGEVVNDLFLRAIDFLVRLFRRR